MSPKNSNLVNFNLNYEMIPLDKTVHPELNEQSLESLKNVNVRTVYDFVKTDVKIIERNSELIFKDVLDLKKKFIKKYSAKAENGLECFRELLKKSAIISTGFDGLDKLLEGGLYTGRIYELYGFPASGKSSLCFGIIKNILLKHPDQYIYYIDTKHNFQAKKLVKLLNEENLQVMDRLIVQYVPSKEEMLNALIDFKEDLSKGSSFRLLIIDSLPGVIYGQNWKENNFILNRIVNVLHYIACCEVAILVTNISSLWQEGDFRTSSHLQETVSCGKYWTTVPDIQLKIEKINDYYKISTEGGTVELKGVNIWNE